MTRTDLMASFIAIYGSRKIAAEAIGLSPSMLRLIAIGSRPLNDTVAALMIGALCDRAERADKLADAIQRQVVERPVRSKRGANPRDAAGMFA